MIEIIDSNDSRAIRNKNNVLGFYDLVINQKKSEESVGKFISPGYIQHNPRVPQGRDGFKQFMSRVPGRTPEEIKPEWKNSPVLTLINGPYSFMMWDRTDNDPSDPTKQYTWNHFDVLRMENGRVKEHWDEAQIMPPPAGN